MTNRFGYRVYYQYDGPTSSAPLRSPKNADEIADALSNFQNELLHFLSDDEATVSVATDSVKREKNSIIAFVATSLSEKITDEAVAKCLTGLDLYGDKLPKA